MEQLLSRRPERQGTPGNCRLERDQTARQSEQSQSESVGT